MSVKAFTLTMTVGSVLLALLLGAPLFGVAVDLPLIDAINVALCLVVAIVGWACRNQPAPFVRQAVVVTLVGAGLFLIVGELGYWFENMSCNYGAGPPGPDARPMPLVAGVLMFAMAFVSRPIEPD